jgi:tetratricopeptide (TPR) repeat protein/predicted Ser/Thr protein kinase
MDSRNEMQTDSELRFARDSSAPSWGDMVDTLVAFDDDQTTSRGSVEDFGLEARAEFERLRIVLDLVDDPTPAKVDRYRIERVIGRGGMGVVHLAHDPDLKRPVALKLVHAGPFVNRERLHARLQREARVLARLTHPNVVGVYDVGTHEGELFVAMEYVPGTNLRVWQESQPRSTDEVLAAYLQAARGLAAVHRAGIVHRDFKPDNVLISDDGRVLVGDFGLADDRDLDVDLDRTDEGDPIVRTQTGALMGTLRYMAPERLRGEPASKASDQFEFCVSLWEALAGHRPFLGEAREDLSASMTHAPIGGSRLDRKIRRVLERGLAPDPQQRWADFESLIDALDQRGNQGRWFGVIGLLALAGYVLARSILQPEPEPERCEVADRVAELDEVTLVLPEGSSVSASEAVQARFDRMLGELHDEATHACEVRDSEKLDRLARWVDRLERVAEHSDEVAITRTLDTLSDLQFDRALLPPDLANSQVARLIDEAREHIAMGRLAEAERVVQEAAELDTNRSDRAEISLRLGQLAAWRGEPAAALQHYEAAIDHAEAAKLDRHRLAAHLLATPLALRRGGQPELAKDHHRRARPLLERLQLPDDARERIDYDQHEALIANEDEEFDKALSIQKRVLERRIVSGDPLAAAEARKQLALIHHSRADVTEEPEADIAAAVGYYRQVLAELDALDVAPAHALRLETQYNLGLLLFDPTSATDEQFEETWQLMSAIVAVGRSNQYVPAMNRMVAVLLERRKQAPSPPPELLAEAERLGGLLRDELDVKDLSPRVRLEAWIHIAMLHALRGELDALAAADATVHGLAEAGVADGMLPEVERDLVLASHHMQIVAAFESANPQMAHRHALRAKQWADRLPADLTRNPDIASMIASIDAAANPSKAGSQ